MLLSPLLPLQPVLQVLDASGESGDHRVLLVHPPDPLQVAHPALQVLGLGDTRGGGDTDVILRVLFYIQQACITIGV